MNTYENNLKELKSKFPDVYEWMLNEEEDSQIEIISTKSGANGLRIKGFRGRSFSLHDMEDPLSESIEECKKIKFSSDRVTFLIGMELGYMVGAIKENMEKGHKIIVFEKNATILKKALAQTDICTLLKNDNIIFSLPDDESIKANVVKYTSTRRDDDVIVIVNRRFMFVSEEYRDLYDTVEKRIGCSMVAMMTTLNNSQTVAKNEVENFPKFLFSSGIRNLFKKFEKVPGIIISAGPSLEKNVYKLKRAKGRALLVATAPVVRVMLAHNIKPDLIVSIDFNEDNRIHFDGLCDCIDISLVCPIKLTPHIVGGFQGDIFVVQDFGGLSSWLHNNWDYKGYIKGGGSVAIYALMTALACSCDPIIFAGQDLAFSNKSHTSGVHMCENIDQNGHFVWVDGVYGDKVPTSPAFLGFKLAIEEIIGQSDDIAFINCTEGGASIKGTKVMPLIQCVDRYCKDSIDAESIINRSKIIERVDFEGLIRDIEVRIVEIKEMSKLCVEALKTNKKIKKRISRGLIEDPETDKIVIDNYNNSTRLQHFCESFNLLSTFLTKEIFQINRQEYKSTGLTRNKLILLAAQKSLKEVKTRLGNMLRILKKIEHRRRNLAENDKDGRAHYLYGKVLRELGLHKPATEEYRKALELGQDEFYILRDLGIAYQCFGRLAKAEEYFAKALKRAGDQDQQLIKEAYEKTEKIKRKWLEKAESYLAESDWVNALLYARKLLREYPLQRRAREICEEAEGQREEKICSAKKANEEERAQHSTKEKYKGIVEQAKEALNRKEYQRAMGYLEKAIALDYAQDDANTLLACCYSEMGNIDEAKRLFEELSDRFPKSGLFHLNLGRAFIRNGRFSEAAEQLELAVARGKGYYFVLFEAGAIYMNTNNYDKAIECFERYLEMSPDSYELLAKIGTCHLAKGMLWKAKGNYREALKIQPDYEAAQVGLRKIEEMEQRVRLKQGGLEERSVGA